MANFTDLNLPGEGCVLKFRIFPGKSKKPPLVIVHGMTGNLMFMQNIALLLTESQRTILTYDLRGRGKSTVPSDGYSVESHAKDLRRAMSELGYSEISILAHSLGVWIALEYAQNHPVEKLILLDGGGNLSLLRKLKNLHMIRLSLTRLNKIFPSEELYFSEVAGSSFFHTWKRSWADLFRYELNEVEGGFMCNLNPMVIEKELNALGASISNLGLFKLFFTRFGYACQRIQKSRKIPFEKITMPTLLVRGLLPNVKAGDEMLPDFAFQEMLKRFPRIRPLNLHRANHYSMVIDPPLELLREILYFL